MFGFISHVWRSTPCDVSPSAWRQTCCSWGRWSVLRVAVMWLDKHTWPRWSESGIHAAGIPVRWKRRLRRVFTPHPYPPPPCPPSRLPPQTQDGPDTCCSLLEAGAVSLFVTRAAWRFFVWLSSTCQECREDWGAVELGGLLVRLLKPSGSPAEAVEASVVDY